LARATLSVISSVLCRPIDEQHTATCKEELLVLMVGGLRCDYPPGGQHSVLCPLAGAVDPDDLQIHEISPALGSVRRVGDHAAVRPLALRFASNTEESSRQL
jgi:hypothetical protein